MWTRTSTTWISGIRSQLQAQGIYYIASAGAGGVGILKNIAYAILLKPKDFGVLALVTSTAPFLIYIMSRGLLESSTIELPRLYGASKDAEGAGLLLAGLRRFVIESTLWTVLGLTALSTLGFGAVVFLVIPFSATTGALSLLMSDARSRGDLTEYGTSIFLRTILCATFGLMGAGRGGVVGVILGETAAQLLLAVWLYWRKTSAELRPVIPDHREMSRIRSKGWNIMLHQAFQLISQNSDKWLVSLALGAAVLGQYSFAGIFIVGVSLIHSIVYQQIGPAAVRNCAEGTSIIFEYRQVAKTGILLGILVGCAGIFAGGLFFTAVRYFNVPYQLGLQIFPLVVVSAALQSMNHFDWIVALGMKMRVLAHWSGGCVIGVIGFGCIGVFAHFPLWYFAVLAILYRFTALLVSWVLAHRTAVQGNIH